MTRERILQATLVRISSAYYDDVTLDQIAADAGVTVQTVLRRFGSKEGIVRALSESMTPDVTAQRDEAPVGDVAGIIANLVEHYEAIGDLVMLLLRQEERVAPFAEVTASGKAYTVGWIDRVFAPWLAERPEEEQTLLRAQLFAVCDTYMWHLLRRERRLSPEHTEQALVELVKGLLA
ncbi:TetR/AcrR family transcriptional regulator [Microbacterium invictum]|uniref:AcrR family transcriptional regulator n=1 Tax=Microbacterium invictum TaxID=515415 RepID=A0AA40SNQ7_9MICO|nr:MULTISPECIES: TetR/AcrR family transcriptional regulator [Microbacterium]MBB4139597.1 AcrR family transcriptional regulator [Microbacterium invictum]